MDSSSSSVPSSSRSSNPGPSPSPGPDSSGGFRVLVTARSFGASSVEPAALLRQSGCEVISRPGPLAKAEMAELLRDADAVIVGGDRITREAMDGSRRLKVISTHGVGCDNVDVAAARERGIVVCNVPGANAEAVAELTWALILGLAREVPSADATTKRGEWRVFLGSSVSGKHLGVIGLGAVGRRVVQLAGGFRMKVTAFDAARDTEFAGRWGVTYSDIDSVLSAADYVTVHLPLTRETRGILHAGRLRLMKPTAFLVNTSRGGIVDEAALAELVRTGRLAGAATDVYSTEPPPADHPLLSTTGIITTPHMGARTREALTNMSLQAARNVVGALTGNLGDARVVS